MARAISMVFTWIIVVFLLYNYIYLQWSLVKSDHYWLLFILLSLIILSFILSGTETAISATTPQDITEWWDAAEDTRINVSRHLDSPVLNNVPLIRPIGKVLVYLFLIIRPALFMRNNRAVLEVDLESPLTMVVMCNNVINVNIAVVFMVMLNDAADFPPEVPGLPFFGKIASGMSWLPLPGSAGFTSIGVTIVLLLFGELIPKKLAMRYKKRFLQSASWLIVILKILMIPKMLSSGIEHPVSFILNRLTRIKPQ